MSTRPDALEYWQQAHSRVSAGKSQMMSSSKPETSSTCSFSLDSGNVNNDNETNSVQNRDYQEHRRNGPTVEVRTIPLAYDQEAASVSSTISSRSQDGLGVGPELPIAETGSQVSHQKRGVHLRGVAIPYVSTGSTGLTRSHSQSSRLSEGYSNYRS